MKNDDPKHGFASRSNKLRVFALREFLLRGFSIIELMVVVAIIAVLSAVAIPAYRNYLFKSKISEVIGYAAAAAKATNDYLTESGAVIPNGALTAGLCGANMPNQKGTPATANTASWAINAGAAGTCVVTAVSTAAAGNGAAVTITMTPTGNADGSISWACTSGGSQYAPANCQ